jgi:hypothetical protein
MTTTTCKRWLLLGALSLLLAGACNPTPTPPADQPSPASPGAATLPSATSTAAAQPQATLAPTPTPTPTVVPLGAATPTPAPPASRCEGLSGELEIRVLVGPAEAAGMEPVAVGSVPFAVMAGDGSYAVHGQGPISYAEVLTKEWGTYAVTLDLQMAIEGECAGTAGGEELHLTVSMAGDQMVEVTAEGFQAEYPWAGEASQVVSFPLIEGATAEGEGWSFMLHLQGQ